MVATLVIKQWVNEVMRGVEELISSIAEDPSMNKEQLFQTSAIQDPALSVEAQEVRLLIELHKSGHRTLQPSSLFVGQ